MKKVCIFSICISLLVNCGSNNGHDPEAIFTNVLTLELSLGDDENNLPADYLLARPRDLVDNTNGDIIVIDEDKIKVFDRDGKSKLIRGGEGQGSGEFDVIAWRPRISKSGYLSVQDQFYGMNLYRSNYEFVKKGKLLAKRGL